MTEVPHKGLLALHGGRLWHCKTGEVAVLDGADWELGFGPEGMGWLSQAGKEAPLANAETQLKLDSMKGSCGQVASLCWCCTYIHHCTTMFQGVRWQDTVYDMWLLFVNFRKR